VQKIVSMARKADPRGNRTIGVLTKPDTIEERTHHKWLPVLQNTEYQLQLGYFCVVNPSQQNIEDGMTEEEAAKQEAHFFR
jgi:hypothetical protein